MPYAFQGCGTKYYGQRAQASDGSYITTEWFTLLHFPIIPLGSYRVSPVVGSAKTNFYGVGISTSEQFMVRGAPLDLVQVLTVYLWVVAIVPITVGLIVLTANAPPIGGTLIGIIVLFFLGKMTVTKLCSHWNTQAVELCGQQKYAEALPLAERAARLRGRFGKSSANYLIYLSNLAFVHRQLRQFEKAEAYFREALDIRTRVLGPNSADRVASLNDLSQVYLGMGRLDKAEELLRQALDLRGAAYEASGSTHRLILYNLAFVYKQQGRLDQAEPLFRAALATVQPGTADYKVIADDLAAVYVRSARVYVERGDAEQAKGLYRQALATMGEGHAEYAIVAAELAKVDGTPVGGTAGSAGAGASPPP